MKSRPLSIAILVCTAWWLGGCASTRIEPEWVDDEIPCASEQVLWEVLLLSLDKSGYPVGMGADPAARRVTSGWKLSLAPFKSKGWRQKATLEYDRLDGGRYDVRVRIERETNEDMLRPLDPSFAQWEPAQDNVSDARHVLTFVQSFIGGELEVGEPRRLQGR